MDENTADAVVRLRPFCHCRRGTKHFVNTLAHVPTQQLSAVTKMAK